MEPTIGRVVIYTFNDSELVNNNYTKEAPAIITRVWTPTCVNLKVLTDGCHDLWKTSVSLGGGQHQWHWPIIAKTE